MTPIKLTQSQVIAKLETQPLFALRFAVDNNPNGVVVALINAGYEVKSDVTPDELYNLLFKILNEDKQKLISIITTKVAYNKSVPIDNYTYGLYEYFAKKQPANTVTASQKVSLDALLGGLGAGLSTYVAVSTAAGAGGATESEADKTARLEAEATAKKAKDKKTMYWIFGAVGGLLLIAGIYYAVTNKTKDK